MREITIDFTKPIPQADSALWGLVGEHKATLVKCLVDESFEYCDYINAEFELIQGKRIVFENIEREWGSVHFHITQQVSQSYRVALQLVGYKTEPLTEEIQEIAKTEKIYGRFSESVMGAEVEVEDDPTLAEKAFVKAQQAYELAQHENKKTLASLYREDLENQFILNHLGAHYLSCNGSYLRFCSDGSVICRTETVEENGKKFLRLWLDHGPLHFTHVTDFIDIPIVESDVKTSISGGLELNGTGLDLGFNSLEEKVNTLTEIPVVRVLPETADEGDICLLASSNTVEMKDDAIYMDWSEFAQHADEDSTLFLYLYFNDIVEFEFKANRNEQGNNFVHIIESIGSSTKSTIAVFSGGELVTEESKFVINANDGSSTETPISSVSELPKILELPLYNRIHIDSQTGSAPMFYSPYRLMVYHCGRWMNELHSQETIDNHAHNNLGTLNALHSELFESGIILGTPSQYLKFNGKKLRFCDDGYVLSMPADEESDGRTYKTINLISGISDLGISFDGIPSIVKNIADTIRIPTDTINAAFLEEALAQIDNHSHANKTVIDGITEEDIRYWNSIDNHSHANKSVLDGISEDDVAFWTSIDNHSHENKKILDSLTENNIKYWDSIDNHSHSNYTLLQSITGSDVLNWNSMVVKVNTADNGKFMRVVNGKWQAVELKFSAIYTGEAAPTSDIGSDGDIYIQTE